MPQTCPPALGPGPALWAGLPPATLRGIQRRLRCQGLGGQNTRDKHGARRLRVCRQESQGQRTFLNLAPQEGRPL